MCRCEFVRTVLSTSSKISRASSQLQRSSLHSLSIFPCLTSSKKLLARRRRLRTWLASVLSRKAIKINTKKFSSVITKIWLVLANLTFFTKENLCMVLVISVASLPALHHTNSFRKIRWNFKELTFLHFFHDCSLFQFRHSNTQLKKNICFDFVSNVLKKNLTIMFPIRCKHKN